MIPLAVTLFATPRWAEGSLGDSLLDGLAWLLLGTGGLLRLWSILYLGGRKSKDLTCDGPYSLCRNPLYLGSLLAGASVAVFIESWLVLLGVAGVAAFYVYRVIPHEETRLLAKFGDEYRAYCERTPRLLPNFRGFHTREVVPVMVEGLHREIARSCWWLLVPLAFEILDELRTTGWWPHLLTIPM